MSPGFRGRSGAALVLLAAWAVLLASPIAAPAEAQSVRKQIKLARKDLVAFEQELEGVVEKFHGLNDELEETKADLRDIRKVLRDMDRARSLYDRWRDLVFRPLVLDSLEETRTRAEIIEDLLPSLRRHIWEQGLERKNKIDTLQDAIELLQSARAGDLVTKSGVGSGQLITYSADWAAVSMCESSGRWHIDDYFDGGLQFLPTTWWGFGGGQYGHYAYQATRRQQIDIAERVLAVQGPNAWPNCFKALPADTDE
jgi:Transglycosylase-like domain